MMPPPPTSPLFPYTTLFRSIADLQHQFRFRARRLHDHDLGRDAFLRELHVAGTDAVVHLLAEVVERSEEHTSELQSHVNLVCRLLLEKKKTQTTSARLICRT